MGAVADRAETVESWDPCGGGEVSVGASADGALLELEIHFGSEGFRVDEKRGAHFAFEGSAGESAGDFEARAFEFRLQGVQAAFELAHVCDGRCAEIELNAGDFGDDVGARAALDGSRVDCDAAAQVVPTFETRDLTRDFVDGVDSVLWSEPGV